jgi:predicted transposase/invertase (TIGR01784 family)
MWILKKQLLEQRIIDNLPKEEASNIMRTIADSYIEEGFNKGILQGIEKEENKKAIEIAKAMLLDGYAIEKISKITTGLTVEGIEKLK